MRELIQKTKNHEQHYINGKNFSSLYINADSTKSVNIKVQRKIQSYE